MDITRYPEIAIRAIFEARDNLISLVDPECILLGGSFGKASWLMDEEGSLLSDFEIIFIINKHWRRKKIKKLEKKMEYKYKQKFCISGFTKRSILNKLPNNFSWKYPGYLTLNFYDSIREKNIIYRRRKTRITIPEIESSEIPMWETWRLFVNRIGDILKFFCNDDINISEKNYLWQKVFQTIADTILLSINKYTPNISNRYQFWQEVFANQDKYDLTIPTEYYKIVASSLKARINNSITTFSKRIRSLKDLQKLKIILFFYNSIEKQMFLEEKVADFKYNTYLHNMKLINKYSKFYLNIKLSNVYSNLLYFLLYNISLGKHLNIFSIKIPRRHITYLSVVMLFKELNENSINFQKTRILMCKIYKREHVYSLDKNKLLNLVISNWKKFG